MRKRITVNFFYVLILFSDIIIVIIITKALFHYLTQKRNHGNIIGYHNVGGVLSFFDDLLVE